MCLISALTTNNILDKEVLTRENAQRLPLNVLSLASILQENGVIPSVVDLDRIRLKLHKDEDIIKTELFIKHVVDKLVSTNTTFFGFSSICSSYPLTLRIITALKKQRPDSFIILGGPQASASADSTLRAFDSVDSIVRGEADIVLPNLIKELDNHRILNSVYGISYRLDGKVVHNPDSEILQDLNSLPLPAYYLLPHIVEYGFLPLEVGRGCPFHCTFCSTSLFFKHHYRLKSPEVILKQMIKLNQIYGIDSFSLVHDNLTANRNQTETLCQTLIRSKKKFTWSCSARTDCLDNKLIKLMRKAGCRGIFVGIESGSERIQKIIRKNLKIENAKERISSLNSNKIEASASFIIGFPEETFDDLRETANLYTDLLCYDYVDPQLGLLSPLTGTAIHKQHENNLIQDNIISDMAFQGLKQDPEDKEMIKAHPEIFSSFYSVPTIWTDRQYLSELEEFLLSFRGELRWLLVMLKQILGDALRVFNLWLNWKATHRKKNNRKPRDYYFGFSFHEDFRRFCESEIAVKKPDIAHVLLALIEYLNLGSNIKELNMGSPSAEANKAKIELNSRPAIAPYSKINHLKVDYKKIIDYLRNRKDLSKIPKKPSTIVTKYNASRIETIQLSDSSKELLLLCDGKRRVKEIVQIYSRINRKENNIPMEKTCLFGLEILQQQGLIVL
ncbi:MAG: B12-binding domain-containing radical SAM protein [Candidatus Hodarchaeota archaeon]